MKESGIPAFAGMTGVKENQTTYAVPAVDMAEDIARIHVESWREAYSGMIPAAILANIDMAERIAAWRGYLATPGHPTFMAQVGGEAAGFIRTGPLAEPFAGADGHIFSLYVLERFHRRGIGRRLLGLAAGAWLQAGARSLSLGVLVANRGARAFYESLGAKFAQPDTYVWDGHPLEGSIYLIDNLGEVSRFA